MSTPLAHEAASVSEFSIHFVFSIVRPHCLSCCSKGTQRHNDILDKFSKAMQRRYNLSQITATHEGQCYPHWICRKSKTFTRPTQQTKDWFVQVGCWLSLSIYQIIWDRKTNTHDSILQKTISCFVATHPKKGTIARAIWLVYRDLFDTPLLILIHVY